MLLCSDCDATVNYGQKFCHNCGRDLTLSQTPLQIEVGENQSKAPDPVDPCFHRGAKRQRDGTIYCADCSQTVDPNTWQDVGIKGPDLSKNCLHSSLTPLRGPKGERYCEDCGELVPQAGMQEKIPIKENTHQIKEANASSSQNIMKDGQKDFTYPRAEIIWFLLVLAFVVAIIFRIHDSSSSDTTTSSSTISTSEIVSTFSSALGVNINQNDATRGVTFSHVSTSVDFWSAPYVTLLIYPDAASLAADQNNFEQDANSDFNSNRDWESCINVIAVYPPSMQSQVDTAISNWCSSTTATPTP